MIDRKPSNDKGLYLTTGGWRVLSQRGRVCRSFQCHVKVRHSLRLSVTHPGRFALHTYIYTEYKSENAKNARRSQFEKGYRVV